MVQVIGTFGYNCRSGKCDLMDHPDDVVDPTRFYYGIAFSLATGIIVTSYLTIWCYVKSAGAYLKERRYQRIV